MAVLAQQTLVGSIGRVYDKRTVGKDNQSVIEFTVAVTPRKKIDGEWGDGIPYWSTITAWGRLADNIAESLNVGDRVIVHGRTDMKDGYTNKEGKEIEPRPIIIADFVGLELGMNPAKSERKARSNNGESYDRPASKPAQTSKPVPTDDDLDLNLDFDDDDDMQAF